MRADDVGVGQLRAVSNGAIRIGQHAGVCKRADSWGKCVGGAELRLVTNEQARTGERVVFGVVEHNCAGGKSEPSGDDGRRTHVVHVV